MQGEIRREKKKEKSVIWRRPWDYDTKHEVGKLGGKVWAVRDVGVEVIIFACILAGR